MRTSNQINCHDKTSGAFTQILTVMERNHHKKLDTKFFFLSATLQQLRRSWFSNDALTAAVSMREHYLTYCGSWSLLMYKSSLYKSPTINNIHHYKPHTFFFLTILHTARIMLKKEKKKFWSQLQALKLHLRTNVASCVLLCRLITSTPWEILKCTKMSQTGAFLFFAYIVSKAAAAANNRIHTLLPSGRTT